MLFESDTSHYIYIYISISQHNISRAPTNQEEKKKKNWLIGFKHHENRAQHLDETNIHIQFVDIDFKND